MNERQILARLCEDDLSRRLIITPIIDARQQFQPASFDVRLGAEFRTFRITKLAFLDLLEDPAKARLAVRKYGDDHRLRYDGEFVLHPGDFALGVTLEYFKLPPDIAGRLEGKSTWGRLGLVVHATAGFVDPGFDGCLTFELSNAGRLPIKLYPGLRVAQICFYNIAETDIPYRKKVSSLYGGRPSLAESGFYMMKELKYLRSLHQRSASVARGSDAAAVAEDADGVAGRPEQGKKV